jgi:hypothetical protein
MIYALTNKLIKIPVSCLINDMSININYIDTYTHNVNYIIIRDSNNTNFYFEELKLDCLDFPLKNNEIKEKKILSIPSVKIFKKTFNKMFNVASILDNFSYDCFKYDLNLFPLKRNNWETILKNNKIDFVLIESAWHGNDGEWSGSISKFDDKSLLFKIVKYIDKLGLPKVFYNKEDPSNYTIFRNFAKLFNKDNDCVITTDELMVKYYKKLGCKNVFSFPFCCQPIIHNPVEKDLYPEKDIIFPCSFYAKTFPERSKEMEEMIENYYNFLDIYDRQYLFNKLTVQINRINNMSKKYKFPTKFNDIIKGSLQYSQVLYLYKKYNCVMNVNTVINSPTMFSRRVVEASAMSTPVISNSSKGMKKIYGNNIIDYTDREQVEKLIFNDEFRSKTGDKNYKTTMINYTYRKLINKLSSTIFTIEKVNDDIQNLVCLIFLDNETNLKKFNFITKKYNYYIISDTYKNNNMNVISFRELNKLEKKWKYYIIMNENCTYSRTYVDGILLPMLYTDAEIVGKGCYHYRTENNIISRPLEHRFSNRLNINTIAIKLNNNTKKLLNSKIINNINKYLQEKFNGKNMYSTDRYDFIDLDIKYHYMFKNKIKVNKITNHRVNKDQNVLKIVMCQWKRQRNIQKLIFKLNLQNDKNFELYIWNNNYEERRNLELSIKSNQPKFNVYVYHSYENVGGIGRFYMVNHLLNVKYFRFVIFIDDDQIFNSSLVSIFRNVAKEYHSYNWYGRKFIKGNPYVQLDNNGKKKDNKNNRQKVLVNQEFDYGGTGGMIIDTRIFSNLNFFYEFPKEYTFVEDLWMSYFAKKYYNYKIIKVDQNIQTIKDNNDQCENIWDIKNHLLEYCREQGWNV